VYGTVDSVTEAWNSARGAVPTCSEVWLWGADRCCPPSSSSWEEFDALLTESMRDAALRDVHQALLLRLAQLIGGLATAGERRARVAHVAKWCLPSPRVWASVFDALTTTADEGAADEEGEALVREVYEYWRGTGEEEEATLAWARWLLLNKKRGDEAMKAISRVRSREHGGALAQQWGAIVRRQEGLEGGDGGADGREDLGEWP